MSDPIKHFRLAIAAAGLEAPDSINPNGAIHRFSTNGKRGDDSGWYMLHTDGIAAGAFGCWRAGLQSTWCSKSDNDMSAAERDAYRQRIKAMQVQREAEQGQRQQHASQTAAALWQRATPAPAAHEYLTRKGVNPHGVKVDGDKLLIAMRDTAGTLHSLQTIAPDGEKRFHPGGRVKGCYHSIGKPAGVLIICEGYATGASIHEATGHAVAVAFNAGNLEPVGLALHAKYPALKIIVAADDDSHTAGNPGLSKAKTAAMAVDGLLAVPTFPAGRPDKATDFNDLHQLAGADAVRACIDAAQVCAVAGAGDWPEPTPLPNALPPVDPFDPELLPVALRGWVMDIAHRMQCPVDFPAVTALVALSSLIGARAVIQPKARDDWQVVPNLWGAVVGRPGVKKSPALGEALKPLHRLQANEFELWKATHDAWALDCKVEELANADRERKAKGLAGKDPAAARALLEPVDTPAEPTARRFIVNEIGRAHV